MFNTYSDAAPSAASDRKAAEWDALVDDKYNNLKNSCKTKEGAAKLISEWMGDPEAVLADILSTWASKWHVASDVRGRAVMAVLDDLLEGYAKCAAESEVL